MDNVIRTISPQLAFKQFKPTLDDMAKLVKTAPVKDDHDRAALAVMIAAHAFGTAAATLSKDLDMEVDVRAVAEAIVLAITRSESR
jgi:hypothetical protein